MAVELVRIPSNKIKSEPQIYLDFFFFCKEKLSEHLSPGMLCFSVQKKKKKESLFCDNAHKVVRRGESVCLVSHVSRTNLGISEISNKQALHASKPFTPQDSTENPRSVCWLTRYTNHHLHTVTRFCLCAAGKWAVIRLP